MDALNPRVDLEDLLLGIVDTAIEISCADFGNVQLVDQATGELVIVAQRGFPEYWLRFWNERATHEGSCGKASTTGKRIIVEDVTKDPQFAANPEGLTMQLRAGVRAVQSTPLYSRGGELIGIFSTHYKKPWRPTGAVLRTLDSLGRLASLAIEQAQSRFALHDPAALSVSGSAAL